MLRPLWPRHQNLRHAMSLQLTGGVSKGLALLTMDQEYVNRFSIRSVTLQQRLLQGVQALGVGAYEGFLGMPLTDADAPRVPEPTLY